ncbi:hypothetical protein R70723_29020 [Paenibacillus sp. FSL R7-0273]|uniref:ABC transporter ATP-binding protein n=1 Tax=Paenibacillus sp. FSL R7-0273 TaxID=1536772 RepID=UPI0004F6F4D6|nr:ABC transporter ATP-binding protein [Paenibacillus sp. FSL R7-0273]AIQ49475.1 hypothetical protein R70723_29020 [Paenibacillus sp. FSL R7-0273]OMF89676.1 hypothetical protein BK144_19130 [Paenibacillus sp. FSL R7-0273]
MTVLQCNQVSKIINGKAILKDFSFSIQAGEIVGLVGPNGAGKTTLMRLMTGLSRISAGSIHIKEMDINKQFVSYIREIGAIIETPLFYPYLTGFQCLKYYSKLRSVHNDRLKEVVSLLGLTDAIHKKVKTYSLGMRQRLGIAQAILAEPALLILDEPFNGLDPNGVAELRNILKKMAAGGTAVFLSSHTLNELEAICDRAILMSEGRLIQIKDIRIQEAGDFSNMSLSTSDDVKAMALIKTHFTKVDVKRDQVIRLNQIHFDVFTDILLLLKTNGIKVIHMKEEKNTLEETFMTLLGGGKR